MGVLKTKWNTLLLFLQKYERPLGAGLFALGFLTDLFTFGTLPFDVVQWFFVSYLVLAGVTIIGAQSISTFKTRDAWWRKALAVLFPLGAQYAFGGLFSGFVVFYARSSVFSVSWPFLLLLAAVYAGNEYFRKQRDHLVFQTVLLFIALYAYTIFAAPFFIGSIGPLIFLVSTVAAGIIFALFVYVLFVIHKKRVLESIRIIIGANVGVALVVCLSYFTGLIPPLPLALSEEGVYHSVRKDVDGYHLASEAPAPWWHIGTQTLHVSAADSVSVYSAVRAPIRFSSTIVHRWEYFNETSNTWVTVNKVAFPLSGGRVDGYRGYSTKSSVAAGKWRVAVETPNGQTIGRVRFDIEVVGSTPPLTEEVR